MKKRFSLHDLIDAELPLSESQLEAIWHESQVRNPLPKRELAVFFCVYFGPAVLLMVLGAMIIPSGHTKLCTTVLGILMCAWFGVAILLLRRRPRQVRAFRRELNRQGFEICVPCGYWLRGLDAGSTRCPECGKSRRLAKQVMKKSSS